MQLLSFDPRNSTMPRFGLTHVSVGGEMLAHGLPAAADGDAVVVHPQEHAVFIAVGHNAVVVAPIALPRLLVRHRHAHVFGVVHDARRGCLFRVYHVVVPQHLKLAPHVNRRADGNESNECHAIAKQLSH